MKRRAEPSWGCCCRVTCDAAGDLRGAEGRLADALDDRVADLGVVDRALDHRLTVDFRVLGPEEGGVVRLVPGEPLPDRRQDPPLLRPEGAAVPACRSRRETLEVESALGDDVDALCPVRPGRRPDDREDDLDPVLLGVEDGQVVHG